MDIYAETCREKCNALSLSVTHTYTCNIGSHVLFNYFVHLNLIDWTGVRFFIKQADPLKSSCHSMFVRRTRSMCASILVHSFPFDVYFFFKKRCEHVCACVGFFLSLVVPHSLISEFRNLSIEKSQRRKKKVCVFVCKRFIPVIFHSAGSFFVKIVDVQFPYSSSSSSL